MISRFFADNAIAKVRKIDSERRCIKCETFRIKLLHFIHLQFCTFAFYNFPNYDLSFADIVRCDN